MTGKLSARTAKQGIVPVGRVAALRTPLPWRNLVHRPVRLSVSVAAMAFAVLIMFTELGFLNGLYDSQAGVLEAFHADFFMVSSALHILNTHETFPRSLLARAAGVRGVAGVYPIYLEDRLSRLRNPQTGIDHVVRVIAFDPDAPAFTSVDIRAQSMRLRTPGTMLFDDASRPLLGTLQAGMRTELGGRTVTIAGLFHLGPDYYYDGNALMSDETLFTFFPHQNHSQVAVGLIQLDSLASPGSVLSELRGMISPEVEVLTKSELVAREKAEWQKSTPAGYIFSLGVAVGLVIGIFVCYQILHTDISDHLPQWATLKALGYHDGSLVRLVLTQSILLGMMGFAAAVAMTLGLYALLTALTGIITRLTFPRLLFVWLLTLGMCLLAGRLAVRKALRADPAELFR
jgi:putative ABC transport system permease protein